MDCFELLQVFLCLRDDVIISQPGASPHIPRSPSVDSHAGSSGVNMAATETLPPGGNKNILVRDAAWEAVAAEKTVQVHGNTPPASYVALDFY
jgi:hypothetical protein